MKPPRISIWAPTLGQLASFLVMSFLMYLSIAGALEQSIVDRKTPDSILLQKVFTNPVPVDVDDEYVKSRIIRDAIGEYENTLTSVYRRRTDGERQLIADNSKDMRSKVSEKAQKYALDKVLEWESEAENDKLPSGFRFRLDGIDYHLIGQRFPLDRGERIPQGEVLLVTNLDTTIAKPKRIFIETGIHTAIIVLAWSAIGVLINVAPTVKLTRQIAYGLPIKVAWWAPPQVAALAQQLAEDREANERFRSEVDQYKKDVAMERRMVELAPTMLVRCKLPKMGKQAIFTYVNPAVSDQLGWAGLIGQPLNTIVPKQYGGYHTWAGLYDEELGREVGMSKCPMHNHNSRIVGSVRPVKAVTAIGVEIDVMLSVQLLPPDEDGSLNFAATMVDVTSLFEAREAERAAREEAEARRETMAVELQGFNHDVKNAIGGILKMYKSLERSLEKREAKSAFTERENQYLDRILVSATRLHRLNEGMREVRRLDQRKLGDYTPWEIFDAVRRDFTDTNVAWQQQESFKVVCDIDKVSVNVVSNLIQNAKIYCGPTPVIQVRAEVDGKFGVFAVTDNGPGIPEEKQSVVFDLGAGSRLNATIEGTGMGLYQAKKTIESFGGKIWVRNNPGGAPGCTFFFSIPIRE